ncbi:MAG TPA: alpha/beta hydrolase [Chitinophagaceae bacterium]|nr:alpha/beta hydrolase [Chitinophagaceae bacterium]
MNKTVLIFFLSMIVARAQSQSTTGITGKADTSYTNYSAYINTLKTFPNIKMVNEFHSDSVIEKKDITYCTLNTRELKLDVFYPKQKTGKPRIAVLFIHGGGWRTGNRTQHYQLAQRLAKLGYVCITPEYRLSTEALYPAAVYDIKSAIRWTRQNATAFNIDTSRIVAAGFSAGGELAAFMGATNGKPEFEGGVCSNRYSSWVNAVVDIDGILSFVHPESGEGDDSKRISAATNWFGYPKKDNLPLWEQASSLTHAGRHTPPTLFINSSVDRMHAGREDYIKILTQYRIYTETRSFEGAPHSFCLFDPWFEPTLAYIDDFLKKVFTK